MMKKENPWKNINDAFSALCDKKDARTMATEKRLIDANAFTEALENADADVCETYHDSYCDWGFSRKAIEDLLLNIPTVDAEPVVHGRWVMKEPMIRSPFAENYYCSECQTGGSPQWKRCPVCEAKMDRGSYETD